MDLRPATGDATEPAANPWRILRALEGNPMLPSLLTRLLPSAACLAMMLSLAASENPALPPEAQRIGDKADAAIAVVTKATGAQILKIRTQEAKELQRLLDAAEKKKDQPRVDAIQKALTDLNAATASMAAGEPELNLDAAAGPAASLSWVDITGTALGGEKWGYGGVHSMGTIPGTSTALAGISGVGVWATSDGGASWTKCGTGDGQQIAGRPVQFLFDPNAPRTFWVAASYGDALFRSDDGGMTFTHLGGLQHGDGVWVDFCDPQRRTLILGMHEQARSLQLSTNGGQSWSKIGDHLPEGTKFSDHPVIIDAKTFLTNSSGWGGGAESGIFRSADAGMTWTKVSSVGPGGHALVTPDGTIFWQGGNGVVRSSDKGLTWEQLASPARVQLFVVDKDTLGCASENHVLLSKDGGKSWTTFGPALPFKPDGVVFSAKRLSFFAYHLTEARSANAIVRLDLKP
jgi:hypothetical protein